METLTTKEDRHAIYGTLFQALNYMLSHYDIDYQFNEKLYIKFNDGFCWMLPITEQFLTGRCPDFSSGEYGNSLQFLTVNYPEIVPYLPECWPGLYIYYGPKPVKFRYEILKKLINEWKH